MKHPGLINKVKDTKNELFEWSDNNFSKAQNIIKKYPNGREQSAVLPLLDLAQRQNKGWLSVKAIEKVAETLSMSYIRVLEVATFYFMFHLAPVGSKAHFQVCGTTPCLLRGSEDLISVCEARINKKRKNSTKTWPKSSKIYGIFTKFNKISQNSTKFQIIHQNSIKFQKIQQTFTKIQ